MTEQEVTEDAKYSHDEDEIKLKKLEMRLIDKEISTFCKNQKKKMYKSINQIAMFNLIKIQEILNKGGFK